MDIPDLSARVEEYISAELTYASLFWSHHIRDTGPDNEILFELKDLMHNRFLYWLEVLSLLNQVQTATGSIEIMQRYLEVSRIIGCRCCC
jgi:hypothetical protein